jgi:hypothetical protein
MKRFWRTVIFTVFTLAFLVTVPLVLLATAGYRYNLLRGRVEKTGIIQARSNPRGATVWIDGVQQKTTTPLEMRRVLAEDYRVRLTLDGYLPWEKTLSVEQGQTAFTAIVTMLRDALPKLILEGKFVAAAWSPDGNRLAYVRSEEASLQEVGVWSPVGTPLTLSRVSASPSSLAISWSPDGSRLLLSNLAGDRALLTVYVPATNRESQTVGRDLPHGVVSVKWSPDGQSLIAVTAAGIYQVALQGGEVSPLGIGSGLLDATTRDRVIYLIQRDSEGRTLLLRDSKGVPETIATLPNELCRFRAWRGVNLQVADMRNGRLLTFNQDGSLVGERGGVESSASGDGRLVTWNDFEVFVTDADGGKSELLTRLSSPINGCAWHPSGTHVVCATAEKVFAIELDGRDHRNTWDLTRVTGTGALNVTNLGPRLRFTGTIGNQSGLFMRDL